MSADTDPDLARGLCAPQAVLSPKYFYDRLGSMLFTAICELPEYYPTRTEAGILRDHGGAIAARLAPGFTMVDLGAGDCRKAGTLLPVLRPSRYVAVDISADFLQTAVDNLAREHPSVSMHALVRDFTTAWSLPGSLLDGPLLFFYPGSSIGNFAPDDARAFLARLARLGEGAGAAMSRLLIGIDLVKPRAVLEAAYDDALGVTASFNRNALLNVNRVLGSDFDIADWAHMARFDEAESRIEMHLVARRDLVVRWPGGTRSFAHGETIHTENSYKYTVEGFAALLASAGFDTEAVWTDAQDRFAMMLAVSR